ncbi:Lsr2 family protein [Arthrobacter sp. UYCu712]|uniref:histone-like nucleoid-structuring protein Lsr2 n=1 Tax=Arthrobacter sp. UYCu712 TaxID=3156340 RepID=UPI00339AD47E
MARKIHVQLIDDISGEDAQETLRFSLDGADYEIDLAAESAAGFRAALAPFLAHGRRVRSVPGSRSTRAVSSSREETQRIREWAMANGYSPNSRGRISQDIKKAYDDAH